MQADSSYDKDKIREMFIEYDENKDPQIRKKIIESNLYLADILAKRFVNKGIEYDDLYQIACLGLIYAVDRFKVDSKNEFSSFATPTILGELKRYFRDKGWTVKVSRRVQELSKRVQSAIVDLSQNMQESPSIKDIAEYLNESEESIIEAMEASKVYAPESLDKNFDINSNNQDYSYKDMLGVEDFNFQNIEIKDMLDSVLREFSPTEKKIIFLRFYYRETQLAIADRLNISQMTVSRVEKKFIKRVKREYEMN